MKIDNLSIAEAVEKTRLLLAAEASSPALKASIELILVIVTMLLGKFGLNSRNSHKPPSTDLNSNKNKKEKEGKKSGAQPGRQGVNLQPVDHPDETVILKIPKQQLPSGRYHEVGFESRQVIDIKISRVVTEYRAQILKNEFGKKFIASFPEGVSRPIQYGQSIKAHAVYLSQFQLIPYERVADYFVNQAKIPLSVGSLFNFNQEAYVLLERFDELAKSKLSQALLVHADETGININGKKHWLHSASNERWTYFYPHEKRGCHAMNEIGILPQFKGTLVHDHWKPYYSYTQCSHALCNAHHLRELQWVTDHTSFIWAGHMQELLLEINDAKKAATLEVLDVELCAQMRKRYQKIISDGLIEMPVMLKKEVDSEGKKKRGREKKTKELNLLERLRDYENDVLGFMEKSYVPFTNNQGESDIRMTKVQQKISGCFRALEGARIFCRIRSYLLTAQKHQLSVADALESLFRGELPSVFFNEE